jgi:tetratricopeptide (TPR) repeat protein
MSLNNLAFCYAKLGDYSKAIEYITKALTIKKAVLGENHPRYATSLNNLADYYSYLGDYPKAIEYGTEALEILKTILGENHPDYALTLSNLANYYYYLGDYSKAIEYITKALTIKKAVLGENHPEYAGTLSNLSRIYSDHGDYTLAVPYAKESLMIDANNILQMLTQLSAQQRSLYWQNNYSYRFSDFFPSIIYETNSQQASTLYNLSALFSKSLLLTTEMEINQLISESGDEELVSMFEQLRLNRSLLQKMYETPIKDRIYDVDSLAQVADQIEKKLIERSKAYGDFTKKLKTTWQDVQATLEKDEMAVEFLSFDVYGTDSTMVAALTLRKDDKEPKFIPLFELRQLQELSNQQSYICPELTKLIWEPLMGELKNVNRIYFSPAGVLHKIGIEYALGMESYDLIRLSSTREIIGMKSDNKNNSIKDLSATLYGGVDYKTASSNETVLPKEQTENDISTRISVQQHRAFVDSLSLRGVRIDYLPGTLKEVKDIEVSLKGNHIDVKTFTGANATETSVKSLSGKAPKVLHVSTHGFYFTEERAKKEEMLNFLQGDDNSYEDKALTRSGLFLAGADATLKGKEIPMEEDDGILTAKEISLLDLRDVDLVVLSACETGTGDIMQGEGVFGLQRGFKKAGAKTILMSLWKVNDLATQLLMTEFYKNYCQGKDKRESLRQAQKAVREYKDQDGTLLFQDPYYWAGFVMLD